ncbi:MAG: hypothetical protein M3Z56_11065, partial [Bacteroidota bacterium]|nr:hypothetical protein [Bacteroidota bacterium]
MILNAAWQRLLTSDDSLKPVKNNFIYKQEAFIFKRNAPNLQHMRTSLFVFCSIIFFNISAQVVTKRSLVPADVYLLKRINEAQVSPDGKWVVYTVSMADSVKDKTNVDIWMVSWDGKQNVQLTYSEDEESSPKWSPDGKYISFVSARNGDTVSQIWLLDTRGGEAKKITSLKADLNEYAWSPDGKKIAMSIKDQDFSDTSKSKTRRPFVMDRYLFKHDISGYSEGRYTHLYVFDMDTKKLDTLTKGDYDEASPAWSPDGRQLAFVSNRTDNREQNENTDIWVMDATPGAAIKQLTTWPGSDQNPQWSPDGKW